MSRDQNRRSYIVFCAVMSKASKFSISQLNRSTRKSFIGKIAIHIEDSAPQLLSSPFIAIGWGNRSGRRRLERFVNILTGIYGQRDRIGWFLLRMYISSCPPDGRLVRDD